MQSTHATGNVRKDPDSPLLHIHIMVCHIKVELKYLNKPSFFVPVHSIGTLQVW